MTEPDTVIDVTYHEHDSTGYGRAIALAIDLPTAIRAARQDRVGNTDYDAAFILYDDFRTAVEPLGYMPGVLVLRRVDDAADLTRQSPEHDFYAFTPRVILRRA